MSIDIDKFEHEDLDLKSETSGKAISSPLAPLPEPFIQSSQEKMSSGLAKSLVWLLIGCVIGIATYICLSLAIAVFFAKDINSALENSRELITLIWTSLITLASGALGFYFGSNTYKNRY